MPQGTIIPHMETLDMEATQTETPDMDTVSAPKPKRAYKRKEKKQEVGQVTAPAAPIRTPAMDRLEAEILEIVSQRSAANAALRNAKMTSEQAQLNLKSAQEFLFSLEQEVNYRMTLLGQLRGDRLQPQISFTSNGGTSTSLNIAPNANIINPYDPYGAPSQQAGQNFANVSSIPTPSPAGIEVVGGRRVRSESAEATRAML